MFLCLPLPKTPLAAFLTLHLPNLQSVSIEAKARSEETLREFGEDELGLSSDARDHWFRADLVSLLFHNKLAFVNFIWIRDPMPFFPIDLTSQACYEYLMGGLHLLRNVVAQGFTDRNPGPPPARPHRMHWFQKLWDWQDTYSSGIDRRWGDREGDILSRNPVQAVTELSKRKAWVFGQARSSLAGC